jgi:tetratricopeptide (TPR) repeat protein
MAQYSLQNYNAANNAWRSRGSSLKDSTGHQNYLNAKSKVRTTLDTLMAFSDSYSNTLGLNAMFHMYSNNTAEAKKYFELAVKSNIKYVFGHYNLARIYLVEKNYTAALKSIELFDKYGGKPVQGYDTAINIASALKNDAIRSYFTGKKASVNRDWKTALDQLNKCLAIMPDYPPALKMKKDTDKAIARNNWLNDRKKN